MAAGNLVFDDPLARDRPPLTATQRSVLRQLRDDAIDERPIDRTQVLVALQAIDQLLAQCDRTRQEASAALGIRPS